MKTTFAIATCNFEPSEVKYNRQEVIVPCDFIPLIAGDRVRIIEENDGWCFGSKLSNQRDVGLFPANYVKKGFEPELVDSDTEGLSIVKEIYRAVQIWWSRLKELYAKQSDLHYLDEVLDKIDDLLAARKQILSGGVPEEQLNNIRMAISKKMDRVNLLLSLSVTIREETGVPYDPEKISVLQNYKEHSNAEKIVSTDCSDVDEKLDAFSTMISVQSIELNTTYNCEICFTVFDSEKKVFVSETVTFPWKGKDNKKNLRNRNLQALFSGFNRSDCSRKLLLLCRIVQIAPIELSTMRKNPDMEAAHSFCRQILAWSFFDLGDIFDNLRPSNEPKEHLLFMSRVQNSEQVFKSLTIPVDKSADDIRMLILSQVYRGNANDVQMKYPHLFSRHPLLVSKRTDVYTYLDESRNYLYATLTSGELTSKSSDRNVEARVTVLDSNGEVVANCIESVTHNEGDSPSNNGPVSVSEFRSMVYYHEDKPFWFEQLKIRLPEASSQDVHLRITLHSRKQYDKGPFALSYFHLLHNSTLVKNDEQELLVYKIDSSQYSPRSVAYLNLPSSKRLLRDLGNSASKPHSAAFTLSEKSLIKLSTSICSSILSQNEDVVNVLRWRNNPYNLANSLSKLSTPVGEAENEMVRFFSPLLDALFEIWDEREQLELPVFDVIVSLYRLVEEPRNVKCINVLEKYMDRFFFPTAVLKLLKCLNHYIVSASTSNNEKTRNSLKVMGRIFITIVCSMKCARRFQYSLYCPETIRSHLESVLSSIVGLMSEARERMAIQNTALKHLPSIINPILGSGAYEPVELCNVLLRVLNGFGKNIVARERLGFVSQLIDTQLFEHFACRQILLPNCISLLLTHLESDSDVREYPERALECVQIISNLIERLFPLTTPRDSIGALGTDDELNLVLENLYRPVVRAMVQVEKLEGSLEYTRGKFFALILAMLNKMSAQIFDSYLRSRPSIIDKMDFVVEMVQMIRDLLSKCPFPSTWQQMIMIQNKTINKCLRFIMSSSVQSYFARDCFYAQVWEEYMRTVVCFVTQPALQISEEWLREDSDPRVKLRKTAAEELRSVWFMLTTRQKMEYIPKMVGPFLRVALIEDEKIRDATIPIFFDMMQAEFHSNIDSAKGMKLFSDELIAQLDFLINENYGSRTFQEKFTKILTQQCKSDKDLWKGGGQDLIQRVDVLLKYLLEYRQVHETEDCAENDMSRTYQLMRYYEQYEHQELYVLYVYKLYELNIQQNNDIEAAKTLQLHAKLLSWEDAELPEWLVGHNLNQHCATQRQLKDRLYCEVADLYSNGQMWEDAVEVLKELIPVYEQKYVDYNRLALLLDRIASMYRKIASESRVFFYYYLVGFYGRGFPIYLNGHRFIFRSNSLERLPDFLDRMKQIYGHPETIPSMDDSSDLANKPGKYIQVFNVDPICGPCPFDSVQINPSIKDYYRHYNISHFEYSRLTEKRGSKWTSIEDNDVMRTWIAKTRIGTTDSLPSVLRFTPVISNSGQVLISPLRCAVDQMKRKNEQLYETAVLVLQNSTPDVKKITGEIMGVVQANVQGGIRNYLVFFSDKSSQVYESEDRQLASRLHALIIEQVEILEFCLYAHATRADMSTLQLHEHIVEQYLEYKRFVEDNFGLQVTRSILPTGASIHMQVVEDREKKSHSGAGSILDISSTSTGTLKSRGVSAVLNMLSPARRNITSQPPSSSSLNNACALELQPTSSLFEKQFSFSGPMKLSKMNPKLSGEGIRLRASLSVELGPPPLPPRPNNSNSTDV
ncbi:unnamed protein product [Auanema sp. JU1783]|nr:unnamed protein product [Auanema sp. JU1783]